jgi:hypothetical protein
LNAIAILDTKTWLWTMSSSKDNLPSRRAFVSDGLTEEIYLVVAFGKLTIPLHKLKIFLCISYLSYMILGSDPGQYYHDVNVSDLSSNK